MDISNVAIIKVMPTDLEMGPCCPGEIGLAYTDGRVMNWAIRPERLWQWRQVQMDVGRGEGGVQQCPNGSLEADYLLTHGKSPQQVAEELTQAVHGYELYADAPRAASWWLRVLYRRCGRRPQFQIRPLGNLLREIGSSCTAQLPMRSVIDAIYERSPPFGHAAADVVRSADVVARIAAWSHS